LVVVIHHYHTVGTIHSLAATFPDLLSPGDTAPNRRCDTKINRYTIKENRDFAVFLHSQ